MVSAIWAQVAKTCARDSIRTTMGSNAMLRGLQRSMMVSRTCSEHISSTSQRNRGYATAAVALDTDDNFSSPTSDPEAPSDRVHFSALKGIVHDNTLKAITAGPFRHTHMSVVQAEVLPLLPHIAEPHDPKATHPRDLLVKARTGTGKTMAFLIPAIEARLKSLEAEARKSVTDSGLDSERLLSQARLRHARLTVGTLIISPTRELASQIATEAQKLTSHHPGFEVQLFVGGESKHQQLRSFKFGRKDFLVATPGRLRDYLESRDSDVAPALKDTKVLVLDEADTLLDMGFRDDIEAITQKLAPTPIRQTFLFSATVSPAIRQIARLTLADNHRFINCVSEDDSPVHAHIPQYHTVLPSADQQISHILRLIFHDQLVQKDLSKIIVFFPTTKMTQLFTTIINRLAMIALPLRRTSVYEIHSKKAMHTRKNVSQRFRESQGASILVTSDVSARGIDYPGVTRVIQVGLPASPEQYVHRVGRTGRAGHTSGRGDLVLLPWEYNFVTRSMSHIPLKPLTVANFQTETKEIAEAFDAEHPQGAKRSMHSPVSVIAEDIPRAVSELLLKLNPDDVGETMISQLGFYAGRASQMGMNISQIVNGMKEWATTGCGLSEPPYISASLLQKLGADRSNTRTYIPRTSWHDSHAKRRTPGYTPNAGSERRAPYGQHRGGERRGGSFLEGVDFSSFDRTSKFSAGPRQPYQRSGEGSFSGGSRSFDRDSRKPRRDDGNFRTRDDAAPRARYTPRENSGYQGRRSGSEQN